MSFRLSYFAAALLGLLLGCASAKAPPAGPAPSGPPAPVKVAAPAERTTPAAARPATAEPARLRGPTVANVLAQFFAGQQASGADARHVVELIDLNGDGRDDALVLMQSRRYCSASGCEMLVLERTASSFELHSRLRLGRTPLIAAESHTGGWRDLVAPMTTARAGMRLMMVKHTAAGYPDDPAQLALVPPAREVNGRVLFSDD